MWKEITYLLGAVDKQHRSLYLIFVRHFCVVLPISLVIVQSCECELQMFRDIRFYFHAIANASHKLPNPIIVLIYGDWMEQRYSTTNCKWMFGRFGVNLSAINDCTNEKSPIGAPGANWSCNSSTCVRIYHFKDHKTLHLLRMLTRKRNKDIVACLHVFTRRPSQLAAVSRTHFYLSSWLIHMRFRAILMHNCNHYITHYAIMWNAI